MKLVNQFSHRLFASFILWICLWQPVQAMQPPVIDPAMLDMARRAAEIKVTPEMRQRVDKTMEVVKGKLWQDRFKAMQSQVRTTLDLDDVESSIKAQKKSRVKDRLYVFVSSTIPKQTLRNYARDMEKIEGATMVLRGFVNGGRKVSPTAGFIARVLRKDSHCDRPDCAMRGLEVYVDPVLFRRYGITRVPAVVFEENVEMKGYCSDDPKWVNQQKGNYVVYGDAALSYAVGRLYNQSKQPGLKIMLDKLERGKQG